MNPSFYRKILLVRLGALGDILHAIPAQQALRESLPEASLQWITEAAYTPLLKCVPGLDRVWEVHTRRWRRSPLQSRELIALIQEVRREKFDLALDFQGLLKSAALARLSGARRIIGYAPERFKENGIQWLYSEAVEGESNLERHVIDSNIELVRSLVGVGEGRPIVAFRFPDSAVEYVQRNLEDLGASKPVLLNPGAGWETKRWPARKYAELGRRIQRELGMPVIFSYGPGEEQLIEEIQGVWAPEPVPTFPTNIVELGCLSGRARLMVAGDSGPLHLAVAVGTPTVAIMGPTSPGRNGPHNPLDIVVRRDLPCSNSYRRKCDQFICMDISLEDVLEAVRRRMEGIPRQAGVSSEDTGR